MKEHTIDSSAARWAAITALAVTIGFGLQLAMQINVAQRAYELRGSINDISHTAVKMHTLLNSQMGVQMREKAELAREQADYTKDPAHVKRAESMEKAYADHVKAQEAVDAQVARDAAESRRKP